MASRAEAYPRQKSAARKKSRSRTPLAWGVVWGLVLAGIIAAYFAVHYAEVAPLLGPSGLFRLRLIAPLAMLAHQPQLGLPDATADTVAQVLMYAQFPLYGFLLGILWRAAGFLRAATTVVLIHVMAVGAVMILSQL
ncbi:MAG: hypothetical protein QOK38_1897 [Acidobacteriaceae bacterium]|jgi:hypothetical protein|nr:hypothetical protein [Acidobacteriaceae bacterium]